jgi:hypothetical protein
MVCEMLSPKLTHEPAKCGEIQRVLIREREGGERPLGIRCGFESVLSAGSEFRALGIPELDMNHII